MSLWAAPGMAQQGFKAVPGVSEPQVWFSVVIDQWDHLRSGSVCPHLVSGMNLAGQQQPAQALVERVRQGPWQNQTPIFISSCSVSQLSIWLSPAHTVVLPLLWASVHAWSASCWLHGHDLCQDSDSVAGIWKKAVPRAVCSPGRLAFAGTQQQHPSVGCVLVWAHTRLLPLGMRFQQLSRWGYEGIGRPDCSLLSFERLCCPLKSTWTFSVPSWASGMKPFPAPGCKLQDQALTLKICALNAS